MKFFLYTEKEIPNLFDYYTYFSKEIFDIFFSHNKRTLDPHQADFFITCFSDEWQYSSKDGNMQCLGKPKTILSISEVEKLCIYRDIGKHIVFYHSDLEQETPNFYNIPYCSLKNESIILCPPPLHTLNYFNIKSKDRLILASFKGKLQRLAKDGVDHRFKILNKIKQANKEVIIDPKTSKQFNYKNLLANSIFGLVVQGDLPWSYRLTEVINSGAIPLIIDPNFNVNKKIRFLPFDHLLDYSEFSYIIKVDEINSFFSKTIYQIDSKKIQTLQKNLLKINDKVFKDRRTQINFLLDNL